MDLTKNEIESIKKYCPDFKIKDIRGQESIKASKGGVCTHKTKSIIKNYAI